MRYLAAHSARRPVLSVSSSPREQKSRSATGSVRTRRIAQEFHRGIVSFSRIACPFCNIERSDSVGVRELQEVHGTRNKPCSFWTYGPRYYFGLSIAARRSRVPPTLWRTFHESTFPALAFDSCRVGVSDLRTFRGCCGRDHPDQGADQAVPPHRQGGAQ